MYQYKYQEVKVISYAGSSPVIGETRKSDPTQSEIKEVIMEETFFKSNLKLKWVVGLVVSLSLSLGVVYARSYVTSV